MKKHVYLSVAAFTLLLALSTAGAAAAPAPPAPVLGASAAQTGGALNANMTVTLDFPDAEVIDIYHVLGDMAGWNVITDPSVTGRFSVSLRNEPLSRALDLVAGATGFGYILVDNTLVVAPPDRLNAMAKRELAVLSVNSLAPETARALMEAAAPGVVVTIDAAQRLALVSGTPEQVQAAALALTRYDVPAAKEFEFVDQTVAEILRTLAKNAGISVMLEGNMDARMTIYLKDMAMQDAINLVAERAGIQQEVTTAGVRIFRPAGVAASPEAPQAADSQVVKLKYLPVAVAAEMLNSLYPSLDVKTGAGNAFLIITGPVADLSAAFAFLARQDFPSVSLVGIVQYDNNVMAVVEIAGRSYVVREGQTIDDLVIESLTANSVTVRRGERREVVTAGGALK